MAVCAKEAGPGISTTLRGEGGLWYRIPAALPRGGSSNAAGQGLGFRSPAATVETGPLAPAYLFEATNQGALDGLAGYTSLG